MRLPSSIHNVLFTVKAEEVPVDQAPEFIRNLAQGPTVTRYRAKPRYWVWALLIFLLGILVGLATAEAAYAQGPSTGHHAGYNTASYLINRGQVHDVYVSPRADGSYCAAAVCWHPGQQRAWVIHYRTGPNPGPSTPWNYTTSYPISGAKGTNINSATKYVQSRMVQDYGTTYRVSPESVTQSNWVPRTTTTGGYRASVGIIGAAGGNCHVPPACPANR